MIRSAAKNHERVASIVDPADYRRCSRRWTRTTARRAQLPPGDGAEGLCPHRRLRRRDLQLARAEADQAAPTWRAFGGKLSRRCATAKTRIRTLPFTSVRGAPGRRDARQVQGKELSYNNIADTDAACELVAEFAPRPGGGDHQAHQALRRRHRRGVARRLTSALRLRSGLGLRRHRGLNRPVDGELAREDRRDLPRVIIAPEAARRRSRSRGQEEPAPAARRRPARSARAGPDGALGRGRLLGAGSRHGRLEPPRCKSSPSASRPRAELADLEFAWRVCKHVKSNAIVYAKGGATVGIGAGQMSRVDSARVAAQKAKDAAGAGTPATVGSVVASDAYFPFADGVVEAIEAGATAVIQPGGSLRDAEVIAAADAADVAMVFTGMRHFRH